MGLRILAIDTATEALSVSLALDDTATEALSVSLALDDGAGSRQIDRYLEIERGHAEQLLPLVEAVLAEGGVALAGLDAIAFGRGPGGFTGVRLAASVAQGLAFGAGIGVVPVSDLAAVAHRVAQEDATIMHVLVANDARMKEVYWARYDVGPVPALQGEERVDPPAAVSLAAPPSATACAPRWAAAGRGLRAWPDLAARASKEGAILFPDYLPRASEVLALARPEVAAGRVLDPTQALPVYVRDRVAVPS